MALDIPDILYDTRKASDCIAKAKDDFMGNATEPLPREPQAQTSGREKIRTRCGRFGEVVSIELKSYFAGAIEPKRHVLIHTEQFLMAE
jgi:hypothetical protein